MYLSKLGDRPAFLDQILEDIHSARSKCLRPKGVPAPNPDWSLLKEVDNYIDNECLHSNDFAPYQHDHAVRMSIIKDKIFFKFGIEDEDIFYLLDKQRKKT